MLKGHCKIELIYAQTGRRELQEHDNMVTKALEYFYKKGGITNRSAFNASYINSNALYYMLGGVMCLDTALTESNEIVRVPAGVGMTANGARDILNSGAPIELGSYNDTESGWQQDGSLKMVWDWTTSQGNGVIASVGLSSIYGGMRGIGNKSVTNKANSFSAGGYNSVTNLEGISGIPLGYKDNRVYSLQSFVNVDKWTIKIYDFPYSQIDIRDNMTAREVDEIEVSIPSAIQNLPYDRSVQNLMGYGEEYKIHQNGDDVFIILVSSNTGYLAVADTSMFTDDYPAYVIKFNIPTGAVTATILSPTSTGLPAINPTRLQSIYFTYGISSKWAIIDDYLIDITNLANTSEFDGGAHTSGAVSPRVLTAQTEDVFTVGSYQYDAISKTKRLTNGEALGGIGNLPDNPLMRFGGSALYRDYNILATIFNLEEPVTKTADKTMKVTYVLSFTN